jgi:hypothetical protein
MVEDTSRRNVIKSAGIVGATVLGGAATTDVVAAQYDDVSWPVSVYDYLFHECCTSHDPERYRSIAGLKVDWYISWDSGGYFNHRPTISGNFESNRQEGRNSRGDPNWVKFGGIGKTALHFDNKSDWYAPQDEGRWLQFCPAVEGEGDGNDANPFAEWLVVNMITRSHPGISILKDLYEGGKALLQTAADHQPRQLQRIHDLGTEIRLTNRRPAAARGWVVSVRRHADVPSAEQHRLRRRLHQGVRHGGDSAVQSHWQQAPARWRRYRGPDAEQAV